VSRSVGPAIPGKSKAGSALPFRCVKQGGIDLIERIFRRVRRQCAEYDVQRVNVE